MAKLSEALDGKRRRHRMSWLRLSAKLGIGKSTLAQLVRSTHDVTRGYKSIDGEVLVTILQFLGRPHTDFTVLNENFRKEDTL
jgi:transcriptional regulator with XRE-family HTH domain